MHKSKAISLVQVISAFFIINYHTGRLAIPVLSNTAKFGFVFNTVFVFLSGYLITKSFSKSEKVSFRNFIYKRINRVYPSLHIALFFVSIYLLSINHFINLKSALFSAAGIGYFISNGEIFGGNHLWFVSVILLCYLLFIPTYNAIQNYPYQFFSVTVGVFIIIAFLKYGSLDGIYNKVSSEVIFRFLYHYIVFSIAIFMGLKSIKNNREILTSKKYILLFIVFFPLYVFLRLNSSLSIFVIASALIASISLISIILLSYPFVKNQVSPIMFFAPITYELYLIHLPVIGVVNIFFHGKIIGYFIVFITSIFLAYLILILSKPYSRLTKRCTEWLLRCAS